MKFSLVLNLLLYKILSHFVLLMTEIFCLTQISQLPTKLCLLSIAISMLFLVVASWQTTWLLILRFWDSSHNGSKLDDKKAVSIYFI
jgi:hypothetical protein